MVLQRPLCLKCVTNIPAFADTDEHFLHLTEENDQFTIDTVVGKDPSVKWIVNVDAHPMPTVELHRYLIHYYGG